MKAIVEQYAKGGFRIDRPDVYISKQNFKLSIEAGTVYWGAFQVESRNKHPIKGMVYDSRYLLRFENHSFISRKFEVRYSFDATCLEAGQNFRGHINVITDGGEFRLPYDISIVPPCVTCGSERIDDLFKFAALAERNWTEATRLFMSDDFRRTFINREPQLKLVYESLLDSHSVDQAMEEFLVLVHKKRTVTLSTDKAKLDLVMPAETESISVTLTKNTWGYTRSEIRSNAEFIIPAKKTLTSADFTANSCDLQVYISPEHVPDGENTGKLIVENIYQKIEIEIHLERPKQRRMDQENRLKEQEYKQCRINLTQAYLDFRMDRIGLDEYVADTLEALRVLMEMEPEEDMYRLAVMHMNILKGDYAKVEQEFVRIEADVDRSLMTNQEKCYYSYLKAMMLRDDDTVEKTANMIRRNYRTQEPKMFFFWLLLFVDPVYSEDKGALYRELTEMYEEGENSPIIYFELCDILNANPLMLKRLTPFEITTIKWGLRHNYISDDVLNEFVKLAGRNKEFNKQIFDVLRSIYDKNEDVLRRERLMREHHSLEKEEEVVEETPSFADEEEDDFIFTGFDEDEPEEEPREEINAPGDPLRLSSEDEEYNREEEQLDKKVQQSFDDKFDETIHAEAEERLLKKENENLEVLGSICSMLISANMLDVRYHRFYKAAVLQSLKFIGLNECYIRSMDRTHYELIPPSVLMYLNYKNTLNEDELAYLYANVIYEDLS